MPWEKFPEAYFCGGGPRIRTANVYHEGPDLQSGVAHAIATRPPVFFNKLSIQVCCYAKESMVEFIRAL